MQTTRRTARPGNHRTRVWACNQGTKRLSPDAKHSEIVNGHKIAPITAPKKSKKTYLGLNNLQVPNLNAARGEIGNLKLDLDRPLALCSADAAHGAAEAAHHAAAFVVVAAHRRQIQLGAHQEFLAAAELLDFPHYGRRFGCVVHGADVCAEARRVGVVGYGDDDADVVGGAAALELGFCLGFGGLVWYGDRG
jgi:hypothetical protein